MDATTVERALEVLRPGLAADGFELSVGDISDGGTVGVVLTAKPEACLDCLVPADLMVEIIENAIREQGATVDHVNLTRVGFDTVAEH